MNGTIKSLSIMSPSGFITADNGLNVYFEFSALLPRDGAALAPGQSVVFDLEGGKSPTAINVRLPAHEGVAREPEKHPAGVYLQYVGFDQSEGLRVYRFKRISRGEPAREFTVKADLALFEKHQVGFQEGPALSLRLLSAELAARTALEWPRLQCRLTDREMLAFLASRPVPAAKGWQQRPVPAPRAHSSRT